MEQSRSGCPIKAEGSGATASVLLGVRDAGHQTAPSTLRRRIPHWPVRRRAHPLRSFLTLEQVLHSKCPFAQMVLPSRSVEVGEPCRALTPQMEAPPEEGPRGAQGSRRDVRLGHHAAA